VKDPHNTDIRLKRSGHDSLTDLDTLAKVVTAKLGATVADLACGMRKLGQ
jgi:hypothetical protein